MELQICDFRNSKFQGEAVNKQPGGFGFALDEKYTFLATQWHNSNPIGPYMAIFDDSSKLFASDTINSNNITVYIRKQLKIYKTNRNCVIDFTSANLLIKVQENLKQPMTPRQNRKNRFQQKFRVIQQKKYSPQNHANILSGLLQIQTINPKYFSYQNFVKETFKPKYKNLLNIRESSKQFNLSFHQNGIFIKLAKTTDLVALAGFDGADKQPEIMRKYKYFRDNTKCTIQQSVNSGPSSQLVYERSIQNRKGSSTGLAGLSNPRKQNKCPCELDHNQGDGEQADSQRETEKLRIKNLRQYYKRSLAFINKYLNLAGFYSLKSDFDQIMKQINVYDRGKFAQVKLQNNGYQLDANQNPIIPKQSNNQNNLCTIEDLKKELDWAKSGKSVGHRQSSNRRSGALGQVTPVKQYSSPRYKSPQRRQSYHNTTATVKASKNNEESYLKYNPQADYLKRDSYQKYNPQTDYLKKERPDRSKSHKTLKYLDSEAEDPKQKDQPNYQPSRNEQYKDTRSMYTGEKRKSPISYKFKYTEEQNNSNGNSKFQYKATPKRYY